MPEDKIEKILKDMKKHGFPLEVKTSEALKAYGWKVSNQVDYLDSEKKIERTVDILAAKNILTQPLEAPATSNWDFDLGLVIECKKSSKPWVFYASSFNFYTREILWKAMDSACIIINSLAYQNKVHETLRGIMEDFLFNNHLNSPIFGELGYIPFEAFTQGEGQGIHKACMQVCNAILDFYDRFDDLHREFPFGEILVPIIVLDGHLYSYENEKLTPENGLYYYMTYGRHAFMFEIVTEGFLDTYLATFDEQIQRFLNK